MDHPLPPDEPELRSELGQTVSLLAMTAVVIVAGLLIGLAF